MISKTLDALKADKEDLNDIQQFEEKVKTRKHILKAVAKTKDADRTENRS